MADSYRHRFHNYYSSRAWYKGKNHKDIYYKGHYHKALYKGNKLLWARINTCFLKAIRLPLNSNIKLTKVQYWRPYEYYGDTFHSIGFRYFKNYTYGANIDEVGIFGVLLDGRVDKIVPPADRVYIFYGFRADDDWAIYNYWHPTDNQREYGFALWNKEYAFSWDFDKLFFKNGKIVFFVYGANAVNGTNRKELSFLAMVRGKKNLCPNLFLGPEYTSMIVDYTAPGAIQICTDKKIPYNCTFSINDYNHSYNYYLHPHIKNEQPEIDNYLRSGSIWYYNQLLPKGTAELLIQNMNVIEIEGNSD